MYGILYNILLIAVCRYFSYSICFPSPYPTICFLCVLWSKDRPPEFLYLSTRCTFHCAVMCLLWPSKESYTPTHTHEHILNEDLTSGCTTFHHSLLAVTKYWKRIDCIIMESIFESK